jgi:hypothetical protein
MDKLLGALKRSRHGHRDWLRLKSDGIMIDFYQCQGCCGHFVEPSGTVNLIGCRLRNPRSKSTFDARGGEPNGGPIVA